MAAVRHLEFSKIGILVTWPQSNMIYRAACDTKYFCKSISNANSFSIANTKYKTHIIYFVFKKIQNTYHKFGSHIFHFHDTVR